MLPVIRPTVAGAVAGLLIAASIPAQAASSVAGGSQPAHDSRTGAIYSIGMRPDGVAAVTLRVDDLFVEKLVTSDGETDFKLTLQKETVWIRGSLNGVRVARNGRDVLLPSRGVEEKHLDRVRGLLVGSRAVRAFKEFTAALEAREEDDVLTLVLLVDGAIVGVLDGDVGAVDRIRKRFNRPRAGLRNAAMGLGRRQTFPDCWGMYVNTLMAIDNDHRRCLVEALQQGGYYSYFTKLYCEISWNMRVQGAIWQFISCNSVPTR